MSLIRMLGVWVLCASAVWADERILSFDETVTVQSDGALRVREVIRVNAEGRNIRRGIFRDFPTTYPANGRQVVVGFQFESATRDGQDEPWRTEPFGNGVRVYLGSPSVMLPHGEHTYELVYRTDRQMGFFADHDELYWNVTGNGWDFPIDRATARVVLPAEIPVGDIKLGTPPANTQRQSVTIDRAGNVVEFYSDGTSATTGRILIQNFNDPSALTREGNNLYSSLTAAGPIGATAGSAALQATGVNDPGKNGLGAIQSGTLELSNVDLTDQFANLITTQRSFQAGSRLVTVSDTVLEDIVNLKQR